MVLNDAEELDEELTSIGSGGEYTDLDFDRKLRQANARLKGYVGRNFVERKVIEFEDETVVDLDYQSLESFDKAVNFNGEGNEIIDDSNYTVDLENGTVTFDQSYVDDQFFEGLILVFYYIPTVFKHLELDIAVRNVLETQSIGTTDSVTNTQTDRINARIRSKADEINRKRSTGVQRGDNKNRGSQAPRSYGGE